MTLVRTARVLIVDDSVTMRALFGGIFERARGIEVVGFAADADEARTLMVERRPNVITLDIEMPGMNGLDFLEEIMRERPTPVIMLSSLTQKGSETSLEALRRGAVDCFPKPGRATPAEFNALAPKLAALVIAAANGEVRTARYGKDAPVRSHHGHHPAAAFDWNGKIITISTSAGGVDALLELLPAFPADCPPAVIVLPAEPETVATLIERLRACCPARIVMAEDGRALERGVIQIVSDPATHAVLDRWPDPSVRLVRSDPVNGVRPSASLLFATAARTAGANAVGAILTGDGTDGVAGLKALRATGARTISQDSKTARVDQARAAGAIELDLPLDRIAGAILETCRRMADAA